jgi:hypothetical protein
MSKTSTGEPTEYDLADEGAIESALDQAWQDYPGDGTPTAMRITAQVEWSGVTDRANGGVRTTRLDGLALAPVKVALDKARAAAQKADTARPATSYTAKSWHAQLRVLTGSSRGSAAADKVGLSVTQRTLLGWLAETNDPSAANRAKIAEAYDKLRTWNVDEARTAAQKANHEVAQELSKAMRDRYGAEIRLRDIRGMDLT